MTTKFTPKEYVQLVEVEEQVRALRGEDDVIRFLDYIHTHLKSKSMMNFDELLLNAKTIAGVVN